MVRKRKARESNPAYDIQSYKDEIAKLERSEMEHTVAHYNFTVDEVLASMWPAKMIGLLKEARPYAASSIYPTSHEFEYRGGRYKFVVVPDKSGIATPAYDLVDPTLISLRVAAFLYDLSTIDGLWENVRGVIEALLNGFRLSEVRYLFPQIQSIVAPGHHLRQVQPAPATVEDPVLARNIRTAVGTLTRGLLSNPGRFMPIREAVGFSTMTFQGSSSQTFCWVA